MTEIFERVLGRLGFAPVSFDDVLALPKRLPGLYVIGFHDGDAYVGQTITPLMRLRTHGRRWEDMASVHLRALPEEELNGEELEAVVALEDEGVRLRNISLISQPDFSAEGGALTPRDAARFLAGGDIGDGPRRSDEAQARRHRAKFERLKARHDLRPLAAFLSTYAARCLPRPRQTERRTWVLSCLSARGRGAAVSRLSVGWQETVTFADQGDLFSVDLQMRESMLRPHYGSDLGGLLDRLPGSALAENLYFAGGHDQVRVLLNSTHQALRLLALSPVVKAIRHLNLSLAMRGRSPYLSSHCYDLADLCFNSDRPAC